MNWKVGDWVVFDLDVGQIKELRGGSSASFSDGFCETSGMITNRFRPLTLRSKRIVETFNIYYERLSEIDGNAGFNFPDIHSYFSQLAIAAIDDESLTGPYKAANDFITRAKKYEPTIHGIALFRRQLGKRS